MGWDQSSFLTASMYFITSILTSFMPNTFKDYSIVGPTLIQQSTYHLAYSLTHNDIVGSFPVRNGCMRCMTGLSRTMGLKLIRRRSCCQLRFVQSTIATR